MICSQWKTQQEENPVKTQSNQETKIKQVAEKLSKRPKFFKRELVIFCDPKHPIYFIEPFLQFISPYFHVSVSTYVHSTVANLPDELASFGLFHFSKNANVDLSLTIIWKTIGLDPIMVLPRMHKILGMVNIARYLNRLIEQVDTNILKYETNGLLYANKIDFYLDKVHCVLHDRDTSRSLKLCKKSRYVMGKDISIIDFILEHIDRCGINKES